MSAWVCVSGRLRITLLTSSEPARLEGPTEGMLFFRSHEARLQRWTNNEGKACLSMQEIYKKTILFCWCCLVELKQVKSGLRIMWIMWIELLRLRGLCGLNNDDYMDYVDSMWIMWIMWKKSRWKVDWIMKIMWIMWIIWIMWMMLIELWRLYGLCGFNVDYVEEKQVESGLNYEGTKTHRAHPPLSSSLIQ